MVSGQADHPAWRETWRQKLVPAAAATKHIKPGNPLHDSMTQGDTMMNQQIVQGNWNEIKTKLCQKWHQLTVDELPQIRGDAEQLIGLIQRKTGEVREVIEGYLQEMSDEAGLALSTTSDTVRDYAQHASEAVHDTAQEAADQLRAGYREAERFVRDRPGESLAVCFGAGVISGMLIALCLRAR